MLQARCCGSITRFLGGEDQSRMKSSMLARLRSWGSTKPSDDGKLSAYSSTICQLKALNSLKALNRSHCRP